MKQTVRNIGVLLMRALGSTLVDAETGRVIGRALLIPWRGRILVFGISPSQPIRPIFLPQERLTYWKQELGFTAHPPPDFRREHHGDDHSQSPATG